MEQKQSETELNTGLLSSPATASPSPFGSVKYLSGSWTGTLPSGNWNRRDDRLLCGVPVDGSLSFSVKYSNGDTHTHTPFVCWEHHTLVRRRLAVSLLRQPAGISEPTSKAWAWPC